MSKFGCLVMGPAGAGKTTFCSALVEHLQNNRRSCYYVNLDPAAETFAHQPDIDIKDLISLEDVMEEMGLGPNGGLIYCFEFLLQNLDWLTEPLEPVTEEYLIIIDMPGQIELYTHVSILPALVKHLTRGSLNMNLCASYLLESTFMIDKAKFFAGTLSAMSAMLMLEMPHVNVFSKMDLIKGQLSRRELRRFVDADVGLLEDSDPVRRTGDVFASSPTPPAAEDGTGPSDEQPKAVDVMSSESFNRLNRAVANLIDEFSMVSFLQLNVYDEDSVGAILSYIDDAIQYHEAQEPREPRDDLDIDM